MEEHVLIGDYLKKSNSISPNGRPETKDPECGGIKYWFHSGNEYTTQADWTEFDNKVKEQACIKDRSNALRSKKSGKYTYGPTPGPDPCGKVVWLCDGSEYNSESDYKTTSCGAPPPPPPKTTSRPLLDFSLRHRRCTQFTMYGRVICKSSFL